MNFRPLLVVIKLLILIDLCSVSWCTFESKAGHIRGDFIIGALFPVHEVPDTDSENDPFQCGSVRENFGIQRVEAAFFAVDQINNISVLLPDVKLGIDIRDSCWSTPIALQQTIRLIEQAVPNDVYDITNDACTCPEEKLSPLIGILGPGNSESSIQVQNILQTFGIAQIGYAATSTDLSFKNRFPYFLRVVPPDIYQVNIMIDVLNYYNWNYVSVINTADNYGRSAINSFKELIENNSICIARYHEISGPNSESIGKEVDDVIRDLAADNNAHIIVCFCDAVTVKEVASYIKLLNYTNKFTFLGSDAWMGRVTQLRGLNEEIEGSIILGIDSPYADDFDPYYLSRKPFNNKRNPWFREFWQQKFNCTFKKSADSDTPLCTEQESLTTDYKQDSKISAVIKSIYTLAHGLHNMIADVCNGTIVCDKLNNFNGTQFINYLASVNFTYKEEEISFDEDLDPVAKYKIFNYQKSDNGTYGYVQIGDYINHNLTIWSKAKFRHHQTVTSVCSTPCEPGFYRNNENQGSRTKCCWTCIPCQTNEISINESQCVACQLGYWPNNLKTSCTKLTPIYIHWSDVQSIISLVYANFGIVVTLITAGIFIKYNDTPVVKSSTKELSYMMLFGMVLAHCCTYAFISMPSFLSCYLVRLLPPLSLTIIYSALLVKTNRIARILAISKKKFPNMRPRFMSTSTQITVCMAIIFVQISICIYLLITEPATPKFFYPDYNTVVLGCSMPNEGIVGPFILNAFLVLLCTFHAVKTRNLPQNFNEAKFIGFSMYTTCITWLAFGLIYYGSSLKIITMCVSMSTVALVILVFLFTPKLYIILLRSEKNTRANFVTAKNIRCFIGRGSSDYSNAGNARTTSSCESDKSNLSKANSSQENDGYNLKRPTINPLTTERHL